MRSQAVRISHVFFFLFFSRPFTIQKQDSSPAFYFIPCGMMSLDAKAALALDKSWLGSDVDEKEKMDLSARLLEASTRSNSHLRLDKVWRARGPRAETRRCTSIWIFF